MAVVNSCIAAPEQGEMSWIDSKAGLFCVKIDNL